MERFNIRVYGILINERQEILLSDEHYKGISFTKFPGGGVCVGESLPDALKREFMEECGIEIIVGKLLHLTDTLVTSIFDDSQVIGAYYQVYLRHATQTVIKTENVDIETRSYQSFRWTTLAGFSDKDLYFEMDKHAWQKMQGDIDGSVR